MFDRFSEPARSVLLHARDVARSRDRQCIEPDHILLALMERHPECFREISGHPIDLALVQGEVAQLSPKPESSRKSTRLRFNEQSKRVLQVATYEARSCWEQRQVPRGKPGQSLHEDQRFREARLQQPLNTTKVPRWLERWMLRRTWEVDERHLLLGLLKEAQGSGVAALAKQGVTLEGTRQRLCATGG